MPSSTTTVNASSVMDSDLDLMLGPRKRNQVKRACVNCQKACKKCDNGRPCSRCIKFGLEKTCADSARKERSRSNLVGPFRKNLDGISTAHGYSSLSSPRSGSIDSQEDGESSGWSKLDILSRLCSTVLIHAHEIGRPRSAEPPSVPEPSPDDTPEVHAARTLSILASKARAQERSPELDIATPVTPVEPDEFAKPFEYDHKSFDHKQLVHELGKTGSFGNLTIEQLATGVFGAFPYLSYGSLYPFDILTAAAGGGSNGSTAMHYSNGSNAISAGGLSSPYDLGSTTLSATSTPAATPGTREPNPLDDFAAISDTVRRMEDEASARSKRRRTNTTSVNLPAAGGLSSASISALNVANMTSSLVSATSQVQALDMKTFAPPLAYSAPGAYPPTQVPYHRILGAGDHRSSPSRIYSPPTPPEFCMPGETGLLGEERK
ncbi:hypothetical protein HDU85_001005 [Gaertneriomyces sp. JEL0708]|nr:hypothetical protein HDU85_001005 [Gaertneriomyces sp. JEL0708]